MESIGVSLRESNLHVDGFPDAVRVCRIEGNKAQGLASLTLHLTDLNFALQCLESVNKVPGEQALIREALWRSAVVHFIKCFGPNNSRDDLNYKTIYDGDSEGQSIFVYFKSMRNKQLVHDENAYTQCMPGAVLNRHEIVPKIAKIICPGLTFSTLGQDDWSNLHLLITRARQWIEARFDELCDELTTELEGMPYDQLLALRDVSFTKPEAHAIARSRNKGI